MEVANIKITDYSKEVIKAKNEAVRRALYAIGMHLEGEAKEELNNSPKRVDTGLLRNSITFALSGEPTQTKTYSGDNPSKYNRTGTVPSGSYSSGAVGSKSEDAVYIGTNVEYAPYVHEGVPGRKMAPNRFLKNAVDRNKEQIKEYLEKELKG